MNEPVRRSILVTSPNLEATPLLLFDPAAPHASWTALLEAPDGDSKAELPMERSATAFHVLTSVGLFVCPLRKCYLEGIGVWVDGGDEGEGTVTVRPTEPKLPSSPATLGAPVTGFFMPSLAPLEPDFLSDGWNPPPEATSRTLRELLTEHAHLEPPALPMPRKPFPVHRRGLGQRWGEPLDVALSILQSFHELASLKRAPPALVPFVRLARECDVVVTEGDWAVVKPKEAVQRWVRSLPPVDGDEVVWSGEGPEVLRQGFSYRIGAPLWFTGDHQALGAPRGGPVAALVGPASPAWHCFPRLKHP